MDTLFPGEHFLGYCIIAAKILLLLTSSIVPTNLSNEEVQPTDSGVTEACGSVCLYEEWFFRAHCDDRGLTHIPSCTGCEGATLLELQDNSIASIPPERIAEYYNVKTMDLSGNQISVLESGTFLGLHHLRNIICSHNSIEIILDGALNGTEGTLTRVYLNDNNIHILGDKAFRNLSQLRAIYLNNNYIQSLPQQIFSDLQNLEYLILSNNELNNMESDHFRGLTKLRFLSLDGNNLKAIPEGLFTGLESLEEVLLSHNQLITIPSPQNLGLHFGIERIDLQHNHLNQSADIIPYLMNTTWIVHLNDNPFHCDCYFKSIQNWINTTMNSQTKTSTIDENSLACTFTDGNTYSITHNLPIICSDADTENSTNTNHTIILTTTTQVEYSLPTPNSHHNVTQLWNGNRNVSHDNNKQPTKVEVTYKITIAILTVLVIFFVLWIIKSCCQLISNRRKRTKTRTSVKSDKYDHVPHTDRA